MEGYKDMTFCPFLECTDVDCPRRLTNKVRQRARVWWGGDGAPICQFVDQPDCYQEELNTKDGKAILNHLTNICRGKYNG